jgi:hypothetical protein
VPDPSGPRKRRTREHVIAAQALNHVERFIVRSGFTSQVVQQDYGYDLLMSTYDDEDYVEPGIVYIQLKATESVVRTAQGIAVRMDVRDYRLWVKEWMPVFLVVYDAGQDRGYWLYVQAYFQADSGRRPRPGNKSVRVLIPETNRVGLAFVQYARSRKAAVLSQSLGGIDHHG